MRFNKDYKKIDKDWWSDDQKDKQCKKKTPDGAFKIKDSVRLLFDTKSLGLGYDVPAGDYVFDSYDAYDNTCFVVKKMNTALHVNYNVCLDQIKKIVKLKKLL